jgi:uncharacterized iron-regulated membrane protein
MDFYLIALFFGVSHLLWVYLFAYVMRLEYTAFLAANVVSTALIALLGKVMMPYWQRRFEVALKADRREGDAGLDFLLFIGVLLVCAIISSVMIFRRYGAVGTIGAIGSTVVTQWII